jgi:hypothetical protein
VTFGRSRNAHFSDDPFAMKVFAVLMNSMKTRGDRLREDAQKEEEAKKQEELFIVTNHLNA